MIKGVQIIPLKLLSNERGYLMEVQRVDDNHFSGFGQIYITSTHSGIVKAWYRHHKQTDQIACATGDFKLVLFDSKTAALMEIILNTSSPKLVQIPPGIWHGFKNMGDADGILLHLNSMPFDFTFPDEERLAHDSIEIPYSWQS